MNSKKTLIFLPGLGYDKNLWDKLLKYLPKDKYHLITLDLPPYASEYKNTILNFDNFPYWLKDKLNKLKISYPYTLIGYSLGGYISLKYSINYPNEVEKLVIISSPLRDPKTKYPFIYKILISLGINSSLARKTIKLLSKSGNKLIYKLSNGFPLTSPSFLAKSDIRSLALCMHDLLTHNWKVEASELKTPTLFVYGSKDTAITKTGGTQYFSLVKNKKIVSFPCNHSVPIHYPKSLAKNIIEFIESE